MDKKSKVFYASQELIPVITENMLLQLQEDFKVKTSDRSTGNMDIEIYKNEYLAFVGLKIYKQISFSTTVNGQILCQVYGDGFGGILIPIIIAVVLFLFSAALLPLLLGLAVVGAIFYGIKSKKQVTEDIFSMVQEIVNASSQMPQADNGEKFCSQCGTVNVGGGFCSECGAKI